MVMLRGVNLLDGFPIYQNLPLPKPIVYETQLLADRPLHFEPCAPLANGDLNYVFTTNFATLTHKCSHTKNANELNLSWQPCAVFNRI